MSTTSVLEETESLNLISRKKRASATPSTSPNRIFCGIMTMSYDILKETEKTMIKDPEPLSIEQDSIAKPPTRSSLGDIISPLSYKLSNTDISRANSEDLLKYPAEFDKKRKSKLYTGNLHWRTDNLYKEKHIKIDETSIFIYEGNFEL